MAQFSLRQSYDDGLKAAKKYWLFAITYIGCLIVISYLIQYLGRNSSGLMILGNFIYLVISVYFGAMLTEASLRAVRGEDMTFAGFMRSIPNERLVGYLVVSVLMALATLVGLILLIVPGVIIFLGMSQARYLVIDTGMDAVPALKESMRLMKGNRLMYLAFVILCGLAIIISLLVFVFPALFVIPVVFFAQASVYEQVRASDVA